MVEPHELIAWGLRAVLCGQPWVERCIPLRGAARAHEVVARYEPHLALVGARVDGEPGTDVIRRLRAGHPHLRAALLCSDPALLADDARAAGARGLIPTAWSTADIVAAVRMLVAGGEAFPAMPVAQRRLSPREREVLDLIVTGATNREMGARLALSPDTVKDHTLSLYRKLGARNRSEAIHLAQRRGLLA